MEVEKRSHTLMLKLRVQVYSLMPLLKFLITIRADILMISTGNLMVALKSSPLFLARCKHSRDRNIGDLVFRVVSKLIDKRNTGVPVSLLSNLEIFLLQFPPWWVAGEQTL